MPNRLQTWSTLAAAVLLLAACNQVVPIKEILDNPRQFADKKVTVEGEVSGAFSLFVIKYFLVNDGTGEIGVVSDKALPRKGQKISVSGTVKEAFSLGDQSLTILIEDGSGKGTADAR
jgi:hypothetical protein